MQKINKQYSIQEAYTRASALCAASEHCIDDIQKKLTQMGIAKDDISLILQKLTEQDFLNEHRYAEAFTLDKFRYSNWGRLKIMFALRNKHIQQQTIEEALTLIDKEEYSTRLLKLLQGKNNTLKAKNNYERRGKLMRFATGKGFETDIVSCIITNLINDTDHDDP